MNTRRVVLFISSIITIISLLIVLYFSEGIVHDIFLAFMGSAFVSFMLEIPNYYNMNTENKRKLYGSLYSMKVHATQLKNIIENYINTNSNVAANINEPLLNQIIYDLSILQSVDSYLFFYKKRKYLFSIINDISIKKDNLNMAIIDYEIKHNTVLIELNKNSNNTIYNINAFLVGTELSFIIKNCEELIKGIDNEISLVFTKNMKSQWTIDNQSINNMTSRYKKEKVKHN